MGGVGNTKLGKGRIAPTSREFRKAFVPFWKRRGGKKRQLVVQDKGISIGGLRSTISNYQERTRLVDNSL